MSEENSAYQYQTRSARAVDVGEKPSLEERLADLTDHYAQLRLEEENRHASQMRLYDSEEKARENELRAWLKKDREE